MKLDDLKARLKEECPLLQHAASPQHLRIWFMGGNQPRHILKNGQANLKKHNLSNDNRLLVEVRGAPEQLAEKTALIRVYRRKSTPPAAFLPPITFTFGPEFNSLNKLKQRFAPLFDIPHEYLEVYHYREGSYSYLKLEDQYKKKKGRGGSTQLVAPAAFDTFDDTTILVVKDRRQDPENLDKLVSEYDLYMRARAPEEKKKKNNGNSKASAGDAAELQINVDI
eukprot:TRINITY_DN1076_c0_g1_i2.p1 TRINITY_DN1076_c0_g1~~TRINITY_DN1076_c0_g1_i2.p1  ORF type:complete len:246 (-),score=75.06 TRINITY_DN1076_c0_g1_i2:72-743(-)